MNSVSHENILVTIVRKDMRIADLELTASQLQTRLAEAEAELANAKALIEVLKKDQPPV